MAACREDGADYVLSLTQDELDALVALTGTVRVTGAIGNSAVCDVFRAIYNRCHETYLVREWFSDRIATLDLVA